MSCLACNATDLSLSLDLGSQPLANCLLETADSPYARFPLGLMSCTQCGHGQLVHFAPPEDLFVDYLYASGTSRSLGYYFDWFCDEVKKHFAPGSDVLEIACNDGSLLGRLDKAGFNVLGVDPAANLVDVGRREGLEILCEFWPCEQAIAQRKFDLVVCMNVVAHTPDPAGFLQGVADVLKPDGVCLVQTSQAHMLRNGEFDTIYHEHYSFFTPRSMEALAARVGLELRHIRLTDVHGTSFGFLLTKPGCSRDITRFLTEGAFAVEPELQREDLAQRISGDAAQYTAFGDAARARMEKVAAIVAKARAQGRQVYFVGAAAKAITFMHAAGICPDRVFDEAPLKVGRFIPGLGVPIEPLTALDAAGDPLIVISAWNFRQELASKARAIAGRDDLSFLVYFPEVEEF
ncbi:class I SAM-dependent methyltransferase [Novosphingobium umbonatum]|nr:class I SAM-dependent methyltransferase [Novosphingobium umbonatum]